MKKVAQHYPAIRIAVYGLIAAVLATAGVLGYVTEDQTTQILSVVTSLLGTVGLMFAAANVKTAAPTVDVPAIATAMNEQLTVTAGAVNASVGATVADLRAQAEKALSDGIESLTGRHRAQ
ncbi:hypothetical protein HQO42_15115 [Rhodococcus fascians]|nr:hypothetical protein [Rhodococcus fascians]MBY4237785.1 hypothetical protein [Rhodococcus fascians]MBY4253988.1 hypothetical protein [Rhodococcus fascians]MBY4269141.1 hypothetical protein [Rhodococcus fascians]